MDKKELLKQLRELEEKEEADKQEKIKQDNYKKFIEREEDWFIGKAHADLDFIGKRYSSDRNLPLLPSTVTITGNCGASFRGEAPVTDATNTYFRNVWNTNYTYDERKFQEKLNKLVQTEVNRICRQLPTVLEMMGLQSNDYWVTEENFPKDKLPEVKKEIEKNQAVILNKYSDKEFLKLIRRQNGWVNSETGEHIPEYLDVNLSHSRMILFRYIFKNRPTLQSAFKETNFYKHYKHRIEAETN